MSAVSVRNITIKFGSYTAVDNVSFEAEKGSFITFLGPSGCGKTTLLKTLAGFYTPNKGQIFMDQKDVTRVPPEKRNTAMCFQSYALFPHLKVSENIIFGPKQKKKSASECASRLAKVSAQVDLTTQLDKLPADLSGGQQQRVALARAMATYSGIVLFDEPLSNLDAKLRDQVRFEIRKLQREHGFTAIYVTHDQSEALAMSDKILVLKDGGIEQMGTPQEIYYSPANKFVANFIGTANIMKAEVLSHDTSNNRCRITTPLGELDVETRKPPKSKWMYVSWRPEDAREQNPQRSETGGNQVTLKVIANVFLGNLNDVSVVPLNGGDPYRVQVLGASIMQIGKNYIFYIPPERICFLEEV